MDKVEPSPQELLQRIEKLEEKIKQPQGIVSRTYTIGDQIDAVIRHLRGERNTRINLALGLDCWLRPEDCSEQAFNAKAIKLLEFLRNKFDFQTPAT